MPSLNEQVEEFLAHKRIAVAGVSRDTSHHPVGNLIYRRLKDTGHEVFAVNPNMATFEGARCYADLSSIPGACPMMFGPGADFGHRCMRWVLGVTGGLPK